MSKDVDEFSGSIRDTAIAIRESIGVHVIAVTTAYSERSRVAAVAFEVGKELSQICRLVCLIDCDLVDPALIEAVNGLRTVDDVLIDAKAKNSESYVVFAGQETSPVPLNAHSFKTTIARFTELADIVILDTPPFTDNSSHAALQMADAVIIVVPPGAPTGADASSGQLTFRITGITPDDGQSESREPNNQLRASLFGQAEPVVDMRTTPPTVWADRDDVRDLPPAAVSFTPQPPQEEPASSGSSSGSPRWLRRRRSAKKGYLD